ncbi:TIGR01459 family HAD-type hydrolase [Rhodobaculum claviforme]|uniref:HAD family hydrolase n=1 Tax=Rhodobaculum claviforme TaxID=1549854 RepID=A0A934TN95_9RHOB|nr:HAD family hydrolase [Rhodobaculum claviforme]
MTRIIDRLADIASGYDVLLCDLWGCLHNGHTPYAPAVAALAAFRAGGGRVVLLTNSPRPETGVARQLEAIGVPADVYDFIVSSGDAAQAGMMAGAVGRRVWHLGPEKDHRFFTAIPEHLSDAPPIERVPFEDAEGIVCTGQFSDDDHPDDYRGRFLSARERGLKLLCANPDIVVDHGDRRLWCAGALAQLYTEMGGESLYFGKPHPPIYDLARRRLSAEGGTVPNARILAVGDGIRTDVQGAVAEDIDVILVTGGLAAEETGTHGMTDQPDPDRLAAFLGAHQMSPTYAMGGLR